MSSQRVPVDTNNLTKITWCHPMELSFIFSLKTKSNPIVAQPDSVFLPSGPEAAPGDEITVFFEQCFGFGNLVQAC